jgi:citrate lyase subunit alpha/citrate CoA-transferase
MMRDKLRDSLEDALKACRVENGMTLSFHHHLRNGDHVLNRTLDAAAGLGLRDLKISASALFPVHAPMVAHARHGVFTRLDAGVLSDSLGRAMLDAPLAEPVVMRTHGGRARAVDADELPIDVAVIAAPAVDRFGNISGTAGPSAFGSIGYAMPDAGHARTVIAVTDHYTDDLLERIAISHDLVDYIVPVERIGDPRGIESGTTRLTKDPVALRIARLACRLIEHSGLLRDGLNFQTGAGGASLAAAHFLREAMRERGIKGGFLLGGTTTYLVDMLEEGLFSAMFDVQCFDLAAVRSLAKNPGHREISASLYASPGRKSCYADALDVVLLGATEIDTSFNVNVHTDSGGFVMGGSGGHGDTAAGAKLAIIVAPLVRGRLPIVVDKVLARSTPGEAIDALVTEYGIAINPANTELRDRLRGSNPPDLPILDINELRGIALSLAGTPDPVQQSDRIFALIEGRDGTILDEIRVPA